MENSFVKYKLIVGCLRILHSQKKTPPAQTIHIYISNTPNNWNNFSFFVCLKTGKQIAKIEAFFRCVWALWKPFYFIFLLIILKLKKICQIFESGGWQVCVEGVNVSNLCNATLSPHIHVVTSNEKSWWVERWANERASDQASRMNDPPSHTHTPLRVNKLLFIFLSTFIMGLALPLSLSILTLYLSLVFFLVK